MARRADIRYFDSKQGYYTTFRGKRYKLADGPDDKPDGPTFREALNRFRSIMEQSLVGQAGDQNTVRVVFANYLAFIQSRRSASTFRTRQRHLASFESFNGYGLLSIQDIQHHHIYAWIDYASQEHVWKALGGRIERSSTWGNVAVVAALQSLSAAFNWALKTGLIRRNPVAGVERPESRSRSRDLIIDIELHSAILKTASPALGELLSFLRDTGCRPGEACAAEARYFDASLNAIVYPRSFAIKPGEHRHKTAKRKDRIIFLSGDALQLVKRLAAKHPTGPLFRTKYRKGWTVMGLSKAMTKLRDAAGIEGLTAYTYRHTFATQFLLTGGSVDILAELLGNSPEVIRRHYSHLMSRKDVLRNHLESFTSARDQTRPG